MKSTPELNLDYLNSARLALPSVDQVALVLVGCGGTGSWLAPGLVRIGRLMQDKFAKRVYIAFFDPDTVEEKNCYRQNFCPAEIGRNKANSLAYRYGLAWGMEVMAIGERFEGQIQADGRDTLILVGCVDNPQGRKQIAEFARYHRNVWWLDCGNTKAYGQVLVGGGLKAQDPFALPGWCFWLPLPSERHPELVEESEPALLEHREEGLSCADLALLDSQGMAINQRVAAEATDYLVRMLLTRDLRKMETYMDLESGSSRSVYVTRENVCAQTKEQ